MTNKGLSEEQKKLAKDLRPAQRRYVHNVVAGMSQREAYIDAGYKVKEQQTADTNASRMLSNAKVKAYYDSLMDEAASEAVMTREEALIILSRSARTTIADVADFGALEIGTDEDGEPIYQSTWTIKNLEDIPKEALSSIKSVKAGRGGLVIELHSSQDAIKQLADMQGWKAAKKVEHSGEVQYTEVQRVIVDHSANSEGD